MAPDWDVAEDARVAKPGWCGLTHQNQRLHAQWESAKQDPDAMLKLLTGVTLIPFSCVFPSQCVSCDAKSRSSSDANRPCFLLDKSGRLVAY